MVCVTDQDPVGSEPFWSDPDLDVWDRIRIPALINDTTSTFLGCAKAINTLFLTLLGHFRAYFRQKNFLKKFGRKFI
jgi:hypothetical protein